MKKDLDTSSLCFDDILLVPKHSKIQTRSSLSLETRLGNPTNPEGFVTLGCPVILAPMEYISSTEMIKAVTKYGGIAFVHRHQTINARMQQLRYLSEHLFEKELLGFSINIAECGNKDLIDVALSTGIRILLIDTAFGHTEASIEAVKTLRANVPNHVHIMVGNVSSGAAYNDLMDVGADSVRVGIGGGAACTTRIATGFGVPVLGSVMDVCKDLDVDSVNGVISDGGIKSNGDIVKALAAGASAVMIGHLFAGHQECESLNFRGLASSEIQKDLLQVDLAQAYVEGVAGTANKKGSVEETLSQMINNIKSGLSYAGADSISSLKKTATYIKVSSASLIESRDRL